MDIEQFRKAGYQAIDRICDYYYTLQERPVTSQVEPGYLRKALPCQLFSLLAVKTSVPETGQDFQLVADDYQKLILPGLTHWQHPSFFAYFPTACTFEGMIADLYSSSTCNPGFNWLSSPACTELEAVMMDWAAQLLGLNSAFLNSSGTGGGVIMTSASDSALTAVVAARSLYMRHHPEARLEDLVIYTTSQTHSLGAKAGLVLGLSTKALGVFSEDNYGLRGETLRRALEEDEQSGKKSFILIATVGTTSSGAVDYLPEIQSVVQDYPSLWVHIDAAWAGMSFACPEYREMGYLESINQFSHSFCTNFHKWGLTNFDASSLWIRDRTSLTDALDSTPEYLRTKHGDAGTVIDYRNWHLGLGRRFRSLKIWFVLRSFGVQGIQKYIRRTIELNHSFASMIRSSSQFTLVTPPSYALSVFRLEPQNDPPMDTESLNKLNRLFYDCISARSDILLTRTELNGIFCIRFVVGAARTNEIHIQQAFNLLCAEADLTIKTFEEAQD